MLSLPERVLGLIMYQDAGGGCRFIEWGLLGVYLSLFILIGGLLRKDWRCFVSQHRDDCSFCVWIRMMVRQYLGPCVLLGASLGFVLSEIASGTGSCEWLCELSGR